MKKIKVSGRNVDEALEIASKELLVPLEYIEYEILDEGSKGFLGLGGTPSNIEAWVSINYVAPVEVVPIKAEPVARVIKSPSSDKSVLDVDGSDEFVARIMKVLNDILGAMQIDAKPVLRSVREEQVDVEILGKDAGIFIRNQGQTLDALQYIVGIAASKSAIDKRRIIIDAERYRQRHNEMIMAKAVEYAKAVKENGQEAEFPPQPARERRLVHLALADDPDVSTYSEGEGENRHVVISPK